MPVFQKDSTQLLFVHIPKTGGTTVEEVMLSNGYEMSFRRGGRYGPLNDDDRKRGCSPQHMHAPLLEDTFAGQDFDLIFALVRHPEARLLSEYRFRKITSDPTEFPSFSEWMETVFASYEGDPLLHDNHIRPQSEFIWPASCKVFRLEDGMTTIFASLSDMVGKIAYNGEHWINLDYVAHDSVSTEDRARIEAFYAEDFKRFGY